MIDSQLLAILACPSCHGDLKQQKNKPSNQQSLICQKCNQSYAIKDNILHLVIEQKDK